MLKKILSPIVSLNQHPLLLKKGKLYIFNFGCFIALGTFTGCVLLYYLLKLHLPNMTPEQELSLLIPGLWVVFTAKAFHILVVGKDFFKAPIYHLRKTSFYNQGGQIGALFGLIHLSYMVPLSFAILADAAAISGCVILFIGRLGCYNYGCCYGKPYNGRLAVKYTNELSKIAWSRPELKNTPLYPTQLMEAFFNLLLFVFLFSIYIMVNMPGVVFGIALMAYNVFRLIINRYRADEREGRAVNGTLRIYNGTALVLILVGLAFLLYSYSMQDFHMSTLGLMHKISLETFLDYVLLDNSFYFILGLSLFAFLVYGVHYKKIGRHV